VAIVGPSSRAFWHNFRSTWFLQTNKANLMADGKHVSEKHPYGLTATGYWLIFLGVPWLAGAILFCNWRLLQHSVGEQALPYVLYCAPVAVGVGCMVLFNWLPKRIIVPVGVICWLLTFTLLFRYFWYDPGAN
jgi:hypothetical protein